jgi:hypothetical protein
VVKENKLKYVVMETLVIRIGSHIENNEELFKDILIHNVIRKIMDADTVETTYIEKQQGYHSRKKEILIKLALD